MLFENCEPREFLGGSLMAIKDDDDINLFAKITMRDSECGNGHFHKTCPSMRTWSEFVK
jgi:hypothetical protein